MAEIYAARMLLELSNRSALSQAVQGHRVLGAPPPATAWLPQLVRRALRGMSVHREFVFAVRSVRRGRARVASAADPLTVRDGVGGNPIPLSRRFPMGRRPELRSPDRGQRTGLQVHCTSTRAHEAREACETSWPLGNGRQAYARIMRLDLGKMPN